MELFIIKDVKNGYVDSNGWNDFWLDGQIVNIQIADSLEKAKELLVIIAENHDKDYAIFWNEEKTAFITWDTEAENEDYHLELIKMREYYSLNPEENGYYVINDYLSGLDDDKIEYYSIYINHDRKILNQYSKWL